jgi:TrmH family RNA methyltransferase
VYATPEFYEKHFDAFAGSGLRPAVVPELVSSAVYKGISDTQSPQGVLALVKQLVYSFDDVVGMPSEGAVPPVLLLLENLQDPGNLGTIFRMAEGAGITGIIASKDTVDLYNSKVVRSTMGSVFRMPFVYVEDVLDCAKQLQKCGITTYAAHLDGVDFYASDYTKATCFFIGNEGNGLSDELSALADCKIKIPMCGQVESLNAATAATVLSYEVLRQRRR